MTVSNGQLANQTTFNSSFMSREIDTDTVGKVDLLNADSLSGASVINSQRVINSIASAMGITTAEVYDYLFTWIADYVGSPNDTVKQRINELVLKFAGTGGHAHTGVDGDADQISATDLVNINQLFAEWQAFTTTGATGTSTDVSSLFTAKSNAGSSISPGVITVGQNKCILFNPTTGDQFEDAGGQKVYGRITWSASVWTLSYYTNEAGTETAYSFGSATDIEFYFLEVFTLATRPTIPSTPEFGSIDITGDVVDATTTQRGVVNTVAQVFAGLKQFNSGVTIDTLIQLLLTTDSATTGAAQTIPTPDPVILLTNASLTSISGFTSDSKSRLIIVINKTGNDISLLHDDAGATGIDRILLPNAIDMTWRNDEAFPFIYDTVNSRWNLSSGSGSPFLLQTFGTVPNADGASYNAGTGEFTLQPADETNPGGVSDIQQRFGGLKGFDDGFGTLEVVDSSSTGSDITLTRTKGYYKFTNASLASITMITEPTDISTVLYLTNETGNGVIIKNDAGATAARRILTGTGSDLTWDDGKTLALIYDIDSERWRVSSASGSGSGSGGVKNLITNGSADESALSIFIPYADAAASRPADGDGGSPSVTTSITTSTPLDGIKSYLLTKPASNVQGEGWAVPFTTDPAYRAKSLKITVDFIVNSGTFVAGANGSSPTDGDVIWYIYDVTNSVLIEPSNIKMFSQSSTISDKFEATFQTSSTGASYRLIAHVASTSALAYELKVDNITVSPQVYVYGTPITASQAYTPLGSWDAATYEGSWWRVGDKFNAKVKVTATGAPTANELQFSLTDIVNGLGITIDPSGIMGGMASIGTWAARDLGTAEYDGTVYLYAGSVIYLGRGIGGGQLNKTTPFTVAAGDIFDIEINDIPIVGWSASTRMSDSYDARLIAVSAYSASTVAIPNVTFQKVDFTSVLHDYSANFDLANDRFIAPSAGLYRVGGVVNMAVGSGIRVVQLYKNGSPYLVLNATVAVSGSGFSGALPINYEIDLVAGDFLEIYCYQDSGGASSIVGNFAVTFTKVQNSQTIAANESVGILYKSASGTLNGSDNPTSFLTKISDTHNSYSGSVWTCPAAGFYDVAAHISVNGTTSVGAYTILSLYINGVSTYQAANPGEGGGAGNVYLPFAINHVPLKAGDTLEVQVSTGVTSPTYGGGASFNYLSISRKGV